MHISVGATVRVLGMVFTATQLTLVAIAAVALAALHGLLRYTRLGKAMRATASDPATWRGVRPYIGRIGLTPGLYMTHNPRHGR